MPTLSRPCRALVFACLILSISTAIGLASTPDMVWVAQADGALKILAADGAPITEISDVSQVRAVDVDVAGESIWLLSQGDVYRYDFDGSLEGTAMLGASASVHAAIAAVPTDAGAWIAVDNLLWFVSSDFAVEGSLDLASRVRGLEYDARENALWIATERSLERLGQGEAVPTVVATFNGSVRVSGMAVDSASQVVWLSLPDVVLVLDYDGDEVSRLQVADIERLAADHSEVWGTTKKELLHLDTDGVVLRVEPFGGAGTLVDLAVTWSGDVWTADATSLARVTDDGDIAQLLTFRPPTRIWQLGHGADDFAPEVQILVPEGGSCTGGAMPTLVLSWSDTGSGVDPDSIAASLDQVNLAVDWQTNENGAVGQLLEPLTDGPHTLSTTIQDVVGNTSDPAVATWTVDTAAPSFLSLEPADGYLTNQPQLEVSGLVDESANVYLAAPGATQGLSTESGSFVFNSITLSEGDNQLVVTATDCAGNTAEASLSVALDTEPPGPVDLQLVTAETIGSQISVLGAAGATEAEAWVTATHLRTAAGVDAQASEDGSFTLQIAGGGGDQLRLVATDLAGNQGAAVTLTVPDEPSGDLPPDPSTVAPPNDPTIVTDLADSVEFLYTGADPIQRDVDPETIREEHVAVVRGRVLTRSGAPLPGVRVEVKDHPEFGWTLSRADGQYDLAVNGGGQLVLQFSASGRLPVQRRFEVPWRAWEVLDDLVLLPFDSEVTAIFANAPNAQVAQGSLSSDADGERRATLIFPAGTTASMVLVDGTQQPLESLQVRATEYTVGPTGPRAMPGKLPPASGYTYAVELSVDEAVSASAVSVEFSQPVSLYVENFFGFPTGGIVPLGYYDRTSAAWVPAPNGLVIEILDVSGGLAELDIDGSGIPASAESLAELGVDDDERARLAQLYEAGTSLWRSPIPHFTPWDCNWPYGPPPDATDPPNPRDRPESGNDDDSPDEDTADCTEGSVIECQNQALRKRVRLPGIPFDLQYSSSRAGGRDVSRRATIRLTDSEPAPSLDRVEVNVTVAGQKTTTTFAPDEDLVFEYLWDGRDAYGRPVTGSTSIYVEVRHVYPAFYYEPAEFGQSFAAFSSGTEIARARDEAEIILSRSDRRRVSRPPLSDVGSWNVGGHHLLDRDGKTVLFSDGTRQQVIEGFRRIAGDPDASGDSGDGGPATEALFDSISAIASAPDGSLYILDPTAVKVRRISPSGTITTVAGDGTSGANTGDGGPAVQAGLRFPRDIAVGPEGDLYIATSDSIRRVDRAGVISTLPSYQFEGLAYQPNNLGFSPDGRLHSDTGRGQIVRLEANGTWTPVVGEGWTSLPCFSNCPMDTGPALDAVISFIRGFAFDPSGTLYVTTYDHVRRVTADGIIQTVAGGGQNPQGRSTQDGTLAIEADLSRVGRLGFDADGYLLMADGGENSQPKIWRLAENGRIYRAVGGLRPLEEGAQPLQARVTPVDFALRSDGLILTAQARDVWSAILPSSRGGSGVSVVSRDGAVTYQFGTLGRHLETRDARTEQVLVSFQYDEAGRLIGTMDAFGNQTLIERNEDGDPQAIEGPFGSRVELTTDAFGQLRELNYPSGAQYQLAYSDEGRLLSVTDPVGGTVYYSYSEGGRLLSATDQSLETKEFDRSSVGSDYSVTQTTRDGRSVGYQVDSSPGGGQVRTRDHPDGTRTVTTLGNDDSMEMEVPDGSEVRVARSAHPRWGMQAPLQRAEIRSGGRTLTIENSAFITRPDPAQSQHFVETETTRVNNKLYRSDYDSATGEVNVKTPEGRSYDSVLDEFGRLTRSERPGVQPTQYDYDDRGRLEAVRVGEGDDERLWTLSYGPDGRVESAQDPLGRSRAYAYDADGRLVRQTEEDGSEVTYDYDPLGRVIGVTPPGRQTHRFEYSPVSRPSLYSPPVVDGVGDSVYRYDSERRPTQAELSDGSIIDLDYDFAGRLETISRPGTSLSFGYDSRGRRRSIAKDDGSTVAYSWLDGLLFAENWTGEVSGTVTRTYNSDMQVNRLVVDGESDAYGYDRDGLMVQAGSLNIQRNTENGFIESTNVGSVDTTQSRNDFAELSGLSASFGPSLLYDVDYERDAIGRVTKKVETLDGAIETFEYSYDPVGRLKKVVRNGSVYATYSYDANGNRTAATDPWGAYTATHDEQDRLLSYGDSTFTYDGLGQLESRTEGPWSTTYEYDLAGNLQRVDLPNGQVIEYVIDATDRRIGKKVDGVLVQGFLYSDQLNPVAELDGSGAIKARFVYGTLPHVPDLMVKSGQTYRYVTDQLGSVRLVVDVQSGVIVQRIDYGTFGRVLFDSAPGFQPFGYAGGLADQHTGLVRFGARDYHPVAGRWTAKDPLGFRGGDTNLYSYASADPVNNIDPSGEIIPALALAWAAAEVGLSIYDIYDLFNKFLDSCSGNVELALATLFTVIGIIGPGGGLNAVDDVADGARALDNLGNLKTVKKGRLKKDGIDAEEFKEEFVGGDGGKYNIAVDSDGQVVLVPVRKEGGDPPVQTGVKYDDLKNNPKD